MAAMGEPLSESQQPVGEQSARSPRHAWIVALGLFVFALFPRTVNVGDLSLYADEDISVLSATAVARGEGSLLPSGMEYRRALPLTWANALSIRLFGEDSERSLRLPSALLGALTVPALFLFGRRWFGFGAGLTAALLLSVSEWHLVFSRQSRMYVPLLLFIVLGTWWLWTWVRTGRRTALAGGLAAALVAMFLHRLGMLLAGAPVVWLAFPGAAAVSAPVVLGVAASIAIAGWALGQFWIQAPYGDLPVPPRLGTPAIADSAGTVANPAWLGVGLAIVGVGLAIAVLRRVGEPDDDAPGALLRRVGRVGFALTAGLAAGTGMLYAFAVSGALYLLLARDGVKPIVHRAALPFTAMLGLLAIHLGLWSLGVGFGEAIRASASLPYPHTHTLFVQGPVLVTLFGLTALSLILRPYGEDRWGPAAAVILAVATLAALGLVREAGPTRYLLTTYPLIILVAGAGLYSGLEWTIEWLSKAGTIPTAWSRPTAVILSVVVVLSGLLAGHGLPQTARVILLEHGEPVNELVHMFPMRPDHRSVGRFVRDRRGPGDIVIAEDPLIQGWYTGDIDYWFRRYGDMRRFLRVHPDGVQRDIYVGSTALPEPASLDSLARTRTEPVWLITSAETIGVPRFYYSPEQILWLDSLRRVRQPAHVGEDGVSAVFCLNCR